MNVSMESSIDEEEGSEKVEKEVLDTSVHQPDFVTQLFNNIDWASRVNKERREQLGNRCTWCQVLTISILVLLSQICERRILEYKELRHGLPPLQSGGRAGR